MAPKTNRSPTKSDIEMQKVVQRGALVQTIAKNVSLVCPILAVMGPIWFVGKALQWIAGKDTTLEVSIGFAATISATLVGVPLIWWIASLKKQLRKQGDELIRLRQRASDLEERLLAADK